MQNLTPEGLRVVTEIAGRYGVSLDAALTLLNSLRGGNGAQAQFNHPDLGGMGQWSQGGMIMIGDMFNQDLKHRVSGLCNELAGLLRGPLQAQSQSQSQSGAGVSLFVAGTGGSSQWWPAELGSPASGGAQNDLRYAYFPEACRLAIQQGGRVSVYDTGEHMISGFSQAQSGDQTLTFTSQFGVVRVADLPRAPLRGEQTASAPAPAASSPSSVAAASPQLTGDAIFAAIERLADLHQKNILSQEEFAAKKRELLNRL